MAALLTVLLCACSGSESPKAQPSKSANSAARFDVEQLTIKDSDKDKLRGQVLYVPIYSNVPYREKKEHLDLSAFIAIHNTDLKYPVRITKVLYFDNDGRMVRNFLPKEISLGPMAATNFYIPENDKSGTGANFLVEWLSDAPVSEPLIESVMISITGRGISFLSKGKVIRELR